MRARASIQYLNPKEREILMSNPFHVYRVKHAQSLKSMADLLDISETYYNDLDKGVILEPATKHFEKIDASRGQYKQFQIQYRHFLISYYLGDKMNDKMNGFEIPNDHAFRKFIEFLGLTPSHFSRVFCCDRSIISNILMKRFKSIPIELYSLLSTCGIDSSLLVALDAAVGRDYATR